MSITVEYSIPGQPKVKEALDEQDVDQSVGDFISAFLSTQGVPPGDFYLTYQGTILPEETSLRENGIVGHGETLNLFQRHVPAETLPSLIFTGSSPILS
jgi:hypothetical protein